MPLGQAPFGSRQVPPDEEPPDDDRRSTPDRPPATGRWIFLMGATVLLALVAARGFGRKNANAHGPTGPNPCLTDRSCAAGWRCFAVPKDDPFAVEGECALQCEDSLQCPARFQCEKVAVGKGQVVPVGARGATAEVVGVCRAIGRDAVPEGDG